MTGAETVFKLKTLMKSVGWTVKASSDASTYNSTGDQITTSTSGTGGMANNRAWFRIQSPDGIREFTIQRNNSGNNTTWRVKYSALAKFTGGSPGTTQTPSATDENILLGGGTDAAPSYGTWFATDNTYRLHMAANSSDGYGIWLAALKPLGGRTSNGITTGAFMFDPLKSGSYPVEDVEPYVIYLPTSSGWAGSITTGINAYLKKGLAGEGFVFMPWLKILVGSNDAFTGGISSNVHDGLDYSIDVLYGRQSSLSAPVGFKGTSSILKWNPNPRYIPSLLTINSSKDRICIGDFNLPWNGTDIIM